MRRTPSRALVLAAALALTAPLLALLGSGAPAAAGETDAGRRAEASGLRIWAPATVTAYAYRKRTWTDLGLRAIAEGAAFELWSQRPSYDDRIHTRWVSDAGSVDLPVGAMADFSGITDFLTITVDPRRRGQQTRVLTRKACLNGWSERVRPDAPARSPYPVGCWFNAYTLGSVQGVQQGWATPLLDQSRPLRIGEGTYTVTVTVNPTYADLFAMTTEDATRTLTLEVVGAEDHGGHEHRGSGHRARPQGPASSPVPARQEPSGPRGRADEGGPTPDLRSLPAWGISLSPNTHFLRFSATVWNAGDSPLVVDGFRREGEAVMDAYQYYFDAAGEQTGYEEIGTLHYEDHATHSHWHFDDFARYSLLDAEQQEAVRSKKEAFCLANTDPIDLTVPDAEWRPDNTDLSTSCGDASSLSIREVLAAGWGDTYTQYRAGQSFNIKSLPNGTYYVAVIANPDERLVEQSLDNNVALREIRLSGRTGKRKLWVEQVGLIEEEGYGGTG